MGKKILVLCMVIALLILLPVFSYADLPAGYTELQYIESSGKQWIDTGVNPSIDLSVTIDAELVSSDPTDNLFGSDSFSNGTTYGAFKLSLLSSGLRGYIGSKYTDYITPPSSRFLATLDGTGVTLDGTFYSLSSPVSSLSTSRPIWLFTLHRGENSNGYNSSSIRLYSSQFYLDGVMIRDFIPCQNDSAVLGLWDDVNDVFYSKASGSSDFIAGPIAVPPVPEYSISVSTDGNGSASSDLSVATAGTTVTLTATPDNGYVFSEWQILEGDFDIVNNQFIMPDSDVSVKAVFIPDGYYSVTVENDGNGTGSANPVSAEQGTRVTLTPAPNLGYEFDRWQVVSGSVNISNNQFIMPDSDVVVKAIFKPIVYTITLNQGSNGTATVSQQTAIVGDVITLTATPDDLYSFSFWDVSQGGITVDGNSFTMPASNVVITPVFTKQAAISSGYSFNSGVKEDTDITARQQIADINFGNQPAGEYLINIYSYGQNYGVSFDIGVGSDTTSNRKLPYTQSGGVTTALYTHSGGEMVLDLNFTYYKSVLNSASSGINLINGTWTNGTGSIINTLNQYMTSSGNYIFNIIDVVAIPVGLANSEDYGIYSSIVSFLKSQLNDIKSFLTEQIGRIAGDEEAEADVSKAEEELNKEVEDLNNLGGQLEEQQTSLETQFESDFKVSDDITAQTSTFQGIYTGIFSSFGIFSIFIWLPVVLAVIKKLLRL